MDNWQRIDSVIRWANMTINYFALYIGLPRGENLYQIKKGNNGISRNLADKIVTKFPEVSLAWLLTGEGQMFVDEKLCGVQIPFYQVDVESHITRLDELAPDREMVIPQLTGCDLAMLYNGKAMGYSIPSGSIVFLKKNDARGDYSRTRIRDCLSKNHNFADSSHFGAGFRMAVGCCGPGKFRRYFRQGFRYRAGISGRGQVGN